jgi:hypothetical protein
MGDIKMAEKINNVKKKYTTGKGELTGYISVLTPSPQYDTYNAQILLSKEEGEALTKDLTELRKEQFQLCGKKGKLVDLPIKPYMIQDEETGEETPDKEGRYVLKTGGKGHNSKGETLKKPQFINAKCQPITGSVSIGEGTIARLSIIFSGYKAPIGIGISAKLLGGQIIKLVEYASGFDASEFEVEEDGFDGVGAEVKEDTKPVAATEETDEEEEYGL